MIRRSLFLGLALLLGACGFTPLHGQQQRSMAANLESLTISVEGSSITANANSTIPYRYSEMLKAEIEGQVNPTGARAQKRFHLAIVYSEQEMPLFVNPDGTASRGDLIYNSTYNITRIADGKSVATGTLQSTGSYSTSPTADYASYVSIEDARKRGLLVLAQSYQLRLAALLPTLNNPDAVAKPLAPAADSVPVLQPVRSYETIRQGY